MKIALALIFGVLLGLWLSHLLRFNFLPWEWSSVETGYNLQGQRMLILKSGVCSPGIYVDGSGKKDEIVDVNRFLETSEITDLSYRYGALVTNP